MFQFLNKFFFSGKDKASLITSVFFLFISYTCFYYTIIPGVVYASEDKSFEQNPYLNTPFKIPNYDTEVSISTAKQLKRGLKKANKSGGNVVFILDDGLYDINDTLRVTEDNIAFISRSGDPRNVIIKGNSHIKEKKVGNLFKVIGKHFLLSGMTLQNAGNHTIQIAGEKDADYPVIHNCILQDAFQQLVKVSTSRKTPFSSDFGLIEKCTFEYTAGIGPKYYIGGIDAHGINGWVIRKNIFKDIASPQESVAEHAIHIWDNSSNNLVENNFIEDCDRGIGFGMRFNNKNKTVSRTNSGGIIRDNTIIHYNNNDLFGDTGIILEDSADTLIENNKIWLGHNYPNAIEYRFPSTQNAVIKGNITNKRIISRNGAKAKLLDNKTNAKLEDVLNGY